MSETIKTHIIATIHNDFKTKFGIPRQSGIADSSVSEIVFEKEYRDENALRGIEDFSHLWLIWHFSESDRDEWSPTVRPPRLGGNKRMGVFATRSPFRPNPIGLSSVRLLSVEKTKDRGTVLKVSGADLMDGTPILDIKPYLPFTDSHTDACGGFAEQTKEYAVEVVIPDSISEQFDAEELSALTQILSHDPRPSYQDEPDRIYGLNYGNYDVHFKVSDGVLTVVSVDFLSD